MFVLVCLVKFPAAKRASAPPRPALELRSVISVEIESSWRSLTSTATVQLPTRWLFQGNDVAIKDYLRAGDPIEIALGYNQTLVPEFTGYVSEVKPGIPLTLTCQDEMYLLKRRSVKVSYQQVTVRQLLHDICPPGTRLRTIAADLGQFRIVNATVAKVLEELRRQYGFVSYYRDGILYCGQVYREAKATQLAQFQFERHILDDQLSYRTPDQLKFIVKVTNHVLKGKDMQVTVGDLGEPDAQEQTLQYFNLASEKQLRAYAEADLRRLRRTGYKGSFTTYGLVFAQTSRTHEIIAPGEYVIEDEVEDSTTPDEDGAASPFQLTTNGQATNFGSVRHGQAVRLVSTAYPERNGDFFVDAVKKTFSREGYRQEITLGSQAALTGL